MTHIPVLLNETIDNLCINPNGTYVDATYGAGGHTRLILSKINKGRVIAFDQDNHILKINTNADKRLEIINQNFIYLQNNLSLLDIDKVDGIIADLGLSSFQISSTRGFSYKHDSDLDMRMNPDSDVSAYDVINNYEFEDLKQIFRDFGEIKNHSSLSRQIIKSRDKKKIKTVYDFLESIDFVLPKNKKNKYLSQVFQAIRIEVNSEIENLKSFLIQSCSFLKKGARLIIISYHSLEDRIVKNFFKYGNFKGLENKDIYGNNLSELKAIHKKPIVPDAKEIFENKRSRSAKMRIAIKL
ncbi:MAG: 16S rRNA (cytosine(1402)-N(4))-methyltransferase [Flavobacteriales bacterium]|nr:16S rRNA (cytosine(1402)-N(4))-methyltransferase [Flavobacteriales bacterium]